MTKAWVLNASPLIVLEKIGVLDVISPLASEWLIPHAVLREVCGRSDEERLLRPLATRSRVRVVEKVAVRPGVLAWNLGAGESEVISCCLSRRGRGAVLDDRAARRCAEVMGIPVRGTLGLIVQAKRQGVIPAAGPLFQALISAGLWIAPDLVDRLVRELDETDTGRAGD